MTQKEGNHLEQDINARIKDKTTPKYWSCKMWSNTPVSKILNKNKIWQ
jgi:hypothetical protein